MTEKRFEVSFDEKRIIDIYAVNKNTTEYDIPKSCDLINSLYEENEQLLYKLQQIEEYLQIKIDECKNHKKMKEIVFGVEQAVGYEKALLQFQKGLKRRLNDE